MGQDVLDLRGLGVSFAQLDTSGDGLLDGNDQSIRVDGSDLVLALQGGRIELAGEYSHLPTRTYVQRRTADGKSPREIRRCLKRYIARETFQHL
jgi:hypothetical protein